MSAHSRSMLHKLVSAAVVFVLFLGIFFVASCGGGSSNSTPQPVSIALSPGAVASLNVNGTQQFTATVTGSSNTAVTWTLSCTNTGNCGAISAGGMYTAPATINTADTVTVKATSSADSSKTATAAVNLVPVAVSVAPGSVASMNIGGTQQFTATVTGTTNTAVTWAVSCSGGNCGTVSTSGLYTAPASIASATAVTVKATSSVDAAKSATATVNLVPVAVSVAPGTASLNAGGTKQFTATVTGTTNTAVTWTLSCTNTGNCGTINAGLYTAPATLNSADTVTVTATSSADSTKSATATVNLVPVVAVSLSPTTVSLNAGGTKQFTATVTGTTNTAVTWTLSCTNTGNCGTINAGLYTAPSTLNAADTVTVTATSSADSTKSATATVSLVPVAAVSVTPGSVSLNIGGTQQFTATVTGSTDTTVTWTVTCSESPCGTISASGLYTAPSVVDEDDPVTVKATSNADNTKNATATVNLRAVVVSVSQGTSLNAGGRHQFTATVTGTTNTAVTWSLSCTKTGNCGAIDGTGYYTAPTTIDEADTVTVKAASNLDSTKSATASVTLVPVVAVSLAPPTVSLNAGATQQFTATVTGSTNKAVTWTLSCTNAGNCGTIDGTGLYTAPTTIDVADTVTVTATSSADNTKLGTATVTLTPVVAVSLAPTTISLNAGKTQQFTATVTGNTNKAVTWTLSCTNTGNCGTIDGTGLYTAPATLNTADTVTVTATSSADNTKLGTATVTLTPVVAVTVSPSTATLIGGKTQQFTPTVTGATNTTVTWTLSCTNTGNCGTINAAGLYTAPATISTADTVTVTATSNADNTTTATATVTLANTIVDFTTTLSAVDPYAFSMDVTGYGQGVDITNDATERNLLKNMNMGMMRMGLMYATPGDPNSQIKCSAGGCSDPSATGDAWISNIKALGAEPIVVLSVSAASYAQDAANMVAHFNTTNGVVDPTKPNYIKYWIVGNEPDLNSGLNSAYDPKFNGAWDAMKAVDPNIKIGGPAKASFTGESLSSTLPITKSGNYSGTSQWLDQFLTDCGSRVDFVDFHKYDLSGSQWSDSPTRLNSSGNTYKYQIRPAQVQYMIAHNAASAPRAAQIMVELGEWNISSNSGSISTSPEIRLPYDFFNTLYGASALGNMMTVGARAMVFGDKNTALGMFGDGTTPFPPSGVTLPAGWTPPGVDVPMPIYYAYGMYTGMGQFRHYGTVAVKTSTSIAAAPNGLDVFASNNQKNIVVVNKNNVANTVVFALTGFTTGTADVWQKAAAGGVLGSSDTTGPKYDPSAAQKIGTLNVSNGGFSISVPAYSVTTFVLNPTVTVAMTPPATTLRSGATQQFAPTVTGATDTTVTWSVSCSGGNCGTVDSTGLYTAPATISAADTVTVKATSNAYPSESTTAKVSLLPLVTASLSPTTASLTKNGTAQFTATVTGGATTAVTWSVSCTITGNCGTVSATGLYTAPASINAADTVTVKATTIADPAVVTTAAVTLVPVVTVSVSPTSASLVAGATQQFTPTVTGTLNTVVTWTLSCTNTGNCGTIDATGLYTAPATLTSSDTVTVTATSVADNTKTATATVTLVQSVSVSMSPGSVSLNSAGTQQFTATVSGSSNTAVTWSLSCTNTGNCGTIIAGLYSAPANVVTADTVTVTATSVADGTKIATATVNLVPVVAVSISPIGTVPNPLLLNPGAAQQFTATVTGTSNTAVTWSASGGGSIDPSSGLYTAPASVSSTTVITIMATSAADGTKTATSTVSVSPANATVDFTTPASPYAAIDPFAFGVDISGYGTNNYITNDATEQQRLLALNAGMMRMGLKYAVSGDPNSPIQCSGGGCATGIAGDAWITNIKALGGEPAVIVSITATSYHADAVNLLKHFNVNSSTGQVDPTLPNYVRYWIIGNEPNLNSINASPATDPTTYDAKFIELNDALKAIDPNIKTGGPAAGGSFPTQESPYIDTFLTECATRVNFVDFHKYDSGTPTTMSLANTYLSSSGNTFKYSDRPSQIRGQINAKVTAGILTQAQADQIGIEIGEFNISSDGTDANLSYDFFNTLYSASALGNMMTQGVRGMMYSDKNGPLGLLTETAKTSPYPVLAVDDPMPIYYGYGMYTGMGLFRHYGTTAVTTSTTIAASPNGIDFFASNNQKNIVTVNKDNVAHTVTFALTGYTNGTADVWQRTGTVGTSTPQYVPTAPQKIGTVNITNGGFAISVPAYSVTTFVLNPTITVAVTPRAATLNVGWTQHFTATVTGAADQSVTWTLSCTNTGNCGTIDASGLYTAPSTITNIDTVTVTAKSNAYPTESTTTRITLVPVAGSAQPVSVSLSPTSASLTAGNTQQFTATVTGSSDTTVAWSLSCTNTGNCGTINAGFYTAPATLNVADTVTVTATSHADITKNATASVTLVPVVAVSVSPSSATLLSGGTQQFSATVTGTLNTAVTWTLSCTNVGNCGTIDGTGLYSAPATLNASDTVTVTATSSADNTKLGTATVTLTSVVAISLSPTTVSLKAGVTQQFTATVTGNTNKAVTWTLSCTNTGNCGTIDGTGLYTAPANISVADTVTVTAASSADNSKIKTATVTLVPAARFVQAAQALPTLTGTKQASLTSGMTNYAGDALVVACREGADTTSLSSTTLPTDTAGNTYTYVGKATDAGGGARVSAVYLATNIKAWPSNIVYCNFAINLSTTAGIVVEEYANVAAVDGIAATNGSGSAITGSPATFTSGSLTTTQNGDALIFAINVSGAVTGLAADTAHGYTLPTNGSNGRQAISYLIAGAPGSNNSTSFSWTTGGLFAGGVYLALSPTLPAPSGVTATASIGKVVLTWNQVIGATGYNVKRSTSSGGPYTTVGSTTTALTYTDNTVNAGTTYYYVVTSINSNSESANSTEKSATTPAITVSLTPLTSSVGAGGTQQFTATVTGSLNTLVSWMLSCTNTGNCGTISAAGLYTAPSTLLSEDTVTVTATSVADNTKFATAFVTLNYVPVVVVSLAPTSVTLGVGGTQQFTPTVTGTTNTAVTWTLACSNSDCGSISPNGAYTAPVSIPLADTVTVRATSVADNTKSATATVSLNAPTQPAPANLVTHPDGAVGSVGSQVGLTWQVASGATGYDVWRATASGGPYTKINPTSVTTTYVDDVDSNTYGLYNDTAVAKDTKYYYVVQAVNGSGGISGFSNEAYATPVSAIYQESAASQAINGGNPQSSIAPFTEFTFGSPFAGGSTAGFNAASNAIDASKAIAPAPTTIPSGGYGIYQQMFYGNGGSVTSAYSGLTPGARYTVRLHFSEDFKTGSGQRNFGVQLNNNYVLGSSNDFDPYATASKVYTNSTGSGEFKAFVKEFTSVADGSGQITVGLLIGSVGNPFVNAVEVLPAVPAAPTVLTATPTSTSIGLTWSAGSSDTTSYNVKRATASGGPYTTLATGVSSASYTDTNATYGVTYYYVVSGVNAAGEGVNSNEALAIISNASADFSIAVSGGSQTVQQSSPTAQYTVKVTGVNGSPVVSLSLSGLGPDGSYSFSPASVNGSGYATLTVTEPTPALYMLSVTGTSGSVTRTAPITLNVIGIPDFTISAPASQGTIQGGSALPTIAIGSIYGFSNPVNLSVSGVPGGVTASFSPTSVNGQGGSTLTLATTFATPVVTNVPITITGTSGSTVHSTTLNFSVTAPGDFTVDSAQNSQTVVQGGAATFNTNVGSLNGFAGTVVMNVDGLPAGARASFSNLTVPNASGSTTLTIATDNSTPVGTFPLTITGMNKEFFHRANVTLTVESSGANPPPAPANLAAVGSDANTIGLSWTVSLGATGYNVLRSATQGGPYTQIFSAPANTTVYSDNGVADGTAYYYVVTSVGTGGESGYSNEAGARPHLYPVYQINAGGGAVGTWSADNYAVAGSTRQAGNIVDTSKVDAPAPQAVYQTMRWFGASPYFSYELLNLTPSGTYDVRLHFADNWHGAPGDPRRVSVSINGTSVLSNWDIAGTAGGQYIAITKEFTSIMADGSGKITVAISGGGAGSPMVNGVEVLSATPVAPVAPNQLTAAGGNATNYLSWKSVAGATSYNVYRSTTSGSGYSAIANNVTSTLYTDGTALNGTPYYYVVSASNSAGEGPQSGETSATAAAAPGFYVTAVTSNSTVVPGHSLAYTVTVTPVGGFTGAVTLSASGLPSGATATFNPATVNISNSTPVTATMTLITAATVSGKLNPFSVVGTSGAAQSSAMTSFSTAWVLSWSDEFNGSVGTQPNPTYWSYDLGGGGWGNSELECYTNDPNNVSEDGNGNMVITGNYTPGGFVCKDKNGNVQGTYYYSSARIKTENGTLGTNGFLTYGRYEARIKLPYGRGVWPAFWMLGNGTNCTPPSPGWPSCGEIDIMEHFSQDATIVYSNIHRTYANGTTTGSNPNSCSAAVMNGQRFADDFHTFAIEWAKDSITFFVDDNRCGTTFTPASNTTAAWPYNDHPFDIILNFAIGGVSPTAPDATTVWPQKMLIDYVRVFNAAQ